MPTITTEVQVEIDLEDISSDELIDELEDRGFTVVDPGEKKESVQENEKVLDDIHNLYQDFLLWKDLGMKNEMFEKILKEFFKDTIDEYVV